MNEIDSLHLSKVPPLARHDVIDVSSQVYIRNKSDTFLGKLAPLILIHGFFGAKENFLSTGKQILRMSGRNVHGVDMRNHGSSQHASPMDYPAMARDTIHFIEQHMEGPVCLGGHSMGAKVAMLVALQRPELVERLLVIDNSPESVPLGEQFHLDLLGLCHIENSHEKFMELEYDESKRQMDELLQKYESDRHVRYFLLTNRTKRSVAAKHPHSALLRIPALNFMKDRVVEELGYWPHDTVKNCKFDKPTLVMKGKHSPFVRDSLWKKEFLKYFSNVSISYYDAGHWLVQEKPHQFVEDTVDFLK